LRPVRYSELTALLLTEGSVALQAAGGAAGILIIRDQKDSGIPKQIRHMPEQQM